MLCSALKPSVLLKTFRSKGSPPSESSREVVRALLFINQATAHTKLAIGVLAEEQAEAIASACKKIITERLHDQFPLHYLHRLLVDTACRFYDAATNGASDHAIS